MLKSSLTAIILMAVYIPAFAQVDVVDSEPLNSPSAPTYSSAPSPEPRPARAAAPESYAQIQAMQDELQELRGLVEQQGNELKRLKQQREDDYLDLDRRVSALSKGGASAAKSGDTVEPEVPEKKNLKKDPLNIKGRASSSDVEPVSGDTLVEDTAPAANNSSSAASNDEFSVYSSALNLIVKNKNYDQGVTAMTKYLTQYPKGKYAPNAYFWVASAYQNQNKPEKSIETFEKMIKRYPKEQKSDEARIKLARVYLQRGDKEEARLLLEEVVETGGPQAKSAQDMLQKSF